MNTLAEIIEYHKERAAEGRTLLAGAEQCRHTETAAICRECVEREMAAVATLQRAVADIERLQKAWEATR